jgi:hypothetical protein
MNYYFLFQSNPNPMKLNWQVRKQEERRISPGIE